jgi:hypothetical protein
MDSKDDDNDMAVATTTIHTFFVFIQKLDQNLLRRTHNSIFVPSSASALLPCWYEWKTEQVWTLIAIEKVSIHEFVFEKGKKLTMAMRMAKNLSDYTYGSQAKAPYGPMGSSGVIRQLGLIASVPWLGSYGRCCQKFMTNRFSKIFKNVQTRFNHGHWKYP